MSFTRRYDGDEPVRINKWLAQAGVCSRREAEALIARGAVMVDGETVEDAGRKILPGQTLTFAGGGAETLDARFTAVLNKPVGYVSGQPEPDRVPAVRLLTRDRLWGPDAADAPAVDASLPPLGRLDLDSRGLLLLSDDGVLAKAVIGPASRLDKEYRVRVRGAVTPESLRVLRHGLELDGRSLKPARVELKGEGRLKFVLQEGRNRQIRRMCELVGLRVIDLQRTRIGPLRLGELPEGRWRPLTTTEREALLSDVSGSRSSSALDRK